MKQLKYYMMILSALLMLGSCSDDDDPTTGMDARISLSSDVLQVTKEGGTVSVTVTSDADWRLAGVCDWAHPSATEGQNGDVVTFTVDENTTDEDLSTTFKFFTGASVAPLVIEGRRVADLRRASRVWRRTGHSADRQREWYLSDAHGYGDSFEPFH